MGQKRRRLSRFLVFWKNNQTRFLDNDDEKADAVSQLLVVTPSNKILRFWPTTMAMLAE
jgi:hypothetical protein